MKKQQRQFLVYSIIAVVAIAVVGVAIVWIVGLMNQTATQPAQTKKQAPQYSDKQQLVDEVNKKYGSNDYSGAIDLIEQQQSIDDPATQLLLAGAYANSGNLTKALEIYKKLDAAGKLPKAEFSNVAQTAERAKDYKTAVAYYKKAKEYAVSSKSETADQLAMYDAKITELEKNQ